MIALAWTLVAIALGCAGIYRFTCLAELEPRWAGALLVFGSGAAAGMGLSSCLFFICRLAAPGIPRLSMFLEIAFFAWLLYECWRKQRSAKSPAAPPALFAPWLMAGAAVALLLATSAMSAAWEANPQGDWDAWAIWNLRAKFLAAGDTPNRAWSAALGPAHPEYPMLVPGFVARSWAYAGSWAEAAPIATGYFFLLAMLAIITGGLAIHRGRTIGLLAGLALLSAPVVLHQVIEQYADIPLACYFAGAIVFALLDRPLIAGLLAGLGAWTKDEGALFLLVFLTATTIFRRSQLTRFGAGAIPGALLLLFFKLAMAPRGLAYFSQGFLQRFTDPARFGQTFSAFAHELGSLGTDLYHPILPILALAIGLGFDRDRRKDLLFAGAIPSAMLAGYFCIFLITPYDLKWQLDTSLDRLMAQLWPAFLIAGLVGLREIRGVAVSRKAKVS